MDIEITISFGLLSYVNHRLVCRCPCDRQSVNREKHMFFSDKVCATPLDSTVLLSVESLRKNKEKKGNSWKTQDFKRQQRCTMNPQQKIFLISNTQTPLIQTLAIQGSTLHLVSHDQEIYIYIITRFGSTTSLGPHTPTPRQFSFDNPQFLV